MTGARTRPDTALWRWQTRFLPSRAFDTASRKMFPCSPAMPLPRGMQVEPTTEQPLRPGTSLASSRRPRRASSSLRRRGSLAGGALAAPATSARRGHPEAAAQHARARAPPTGAWHASGGRARSESHREARRWIDGVGI